jgi:hypothetical protein
MPEYGDPYPKGLGMACYAHAMRDDGDQLATTNRTMSAAARHYAALDEQTSIEVRVKTIEIRLNLTNLVEGMIAIGHALIFVKDMLDHGQFGTWLAAEFQWSRDAAEDYMDVARHMPHVPHNAAFAKAALYLLAAPDTPEAARADAIARAGHGEQITVRVARDIIEQHREPPAPDVTAAAPTSTPVNRSTAVPRPPWQRPSRQGRERSDDPWDEPARAVETAIEHLGSPERATLPVELQTLVGQHAQVMSWIERLQAWERALSNAYPIEGEL